MAKRPVMLKLLQKDLETISFSLDQDDLKKLAGVPKIGAKIAWYYREDLEFWENERIAIPASFSWPYKGYIMPGPEREIRGSELDIEDVVIIQFDYPVEKVYPLCNWFALSRLLKNTSLVKAAIYE